MNHILTLEAVQYDFQQWRQRRSKRGSIPDDLWQRVFPLLTRYPISAICSALSLNTAQIRSKLSATSPQHEERLQLKSDFVELSLKTKAVFTERAEISIVLTRKDGVSMTICSFPNVGIKGLIDHFLMGN